MANNYYQATGTLKLKAITPVIKALFGVFEVQEYKDGEAYIMEEGADISYESVADCIATEMNVGRADAVKDCLIEMADKLGKKSEVEAFLGEDSIDGEDDADLEFLFRLALLMDDGHGLTSLYIEGAWTSDKMRLGEFGGNGYYVGKNFVIGVGSSAAAQYGRSVDAAISDNNLVDAARQISSYVQGLLNGITDDGARASVTALLADSLALLADSTQNKKEPATFPQQPTEADTVLRAIQDNLYRNADEAFANYSFGNDVTVTDSDGWVREDDGDLCKIVYLDPIDAPNSESLRASFHVRFTPDGEVDEAYALCMRTGAEIGFMVRND